MKLIIEDDEGRKTVVPFVREEITIGRQEGNTIRLTERNVSRRHARLMRSNGSVLVEDLGSYNGIRINGERISGQVPIHDGDLIQIGDYDLAIQHEGVQVAQPPLPPPIPDGDSEPTAPLARTGGAAPPAVPMPGIVGGAAAVAAALPSVEDVEEASPDDVLPAPESEPPRKASTSIIRAAQVEGSRPRQIVEIDPAEAPRLVVINSQFAGREFACIRNELKIGRADDNDIALDHRSLSRTHAKVVREDSGEWRIIDMQSANGVAVNGEPYAQATLRSHDVIDLGHLKLKFVAAGDPFQVIPSMAAQKRRAINRARLFTLSMLLFSIGGVGLWFLKGAPLPAFLKRVGDPIHPPDEASTPTPEEEAAATDTSSPAQRSPAEAAVEEKLNTARGFIERRDWDKAEQVLNKCRINDQLHPEAKTLLTELHSETELKKSLDKAEKAISLGKLEEANALLDEVSHTKLLRKPLAQLRERWREASEERLALQANGNKPPDARALTLSDSRPVAGPMTGAAGDAQKLYNEGLLLMRNKQVREAKTQLEKCIKADPAFALCHKALGAAYARLNDSEKGAFHYRKFLQLAPHDRDADKVRTILDQYEATKRQ